MLTPNDAFLRLKKEGPFIEKCGRIRWFWHQISVDFKCMARQHKDFINAPILYREFYINDTLITRKRYFLTPKS